MSEELKKCEVCGTDTTWDWILPDNVLHIVCEKCRAWTENQIKKELIWACQSRVLTDKEWECLQGHGATVFFMGDTDTGAMRPTNCLCNPKQATRELHSILRQQCRLRQLANVSYPPTSYLK